MHLLLLSLFQSLYQRTALHIAVREFRVRTVEVLVDNKADINSKDKHGVSLLTDNVFLQCSLSLS